MDWNSDDEVRSLVAEGVEGFKNVRAFAQLILSIMEIRGTTDISHLLNGQMRRPEIRKSFEMAQSTFYNQGEQSFILIKRAPSKPALADHVRKKDGKI